MSEQEIMCDEPLAEVTVIVASKLTPDELSLYEHCEGGACAETNRIQSAMAKVYRVELEESELEHRRVQNTAKEEECRAERIERERAQQETRARERDTNEVRSQRRKPRSKEEQRVDKMRSEYRRMGIPVNF
jgi:preprotein translocase subunit SecF